MIAFLRSLCLRTKGSWSVPWQGLYLIYFGGWYHYPWRSSSCLRGNVFWTFQRRHRQSRCSVGYETRNCSAGWRVGTLWREQTSEIFGPKGTFRRGCIPTITILFVSRLFWKLATTYPNCWHGATVVFSCLLLSDEPASEGVLVIRGH